VEREELTQLIKNGPVRILLNDSNSYEVPSSEFALVSDFAGHTLDRAPIEKMRTMILPLVTMSGVEPLPADL